MTKYAALLGDPVAHSRSPAIMKQLSDISGIAFDYRCIRTTQADLEGALEDLRQDKNCIGVNLTLPHKQRGYELIKDRAPSARATKATNCLVRNHEGAWCAHNTDVAGFEALLDSIEHSSEGETVLVLGAGGAAAAATYALIQKGIQKVIIWNRSHERARFLRSLYGDAVKSIETVEGLEAPSLIVNATSLGLKKGDQSHFEKTFGAGFRELRKKRKGIPCVDLVYATQQEQNTEFLTWVDALGLNGVADGKTMLKAQAIVGVSHWLGLPLELTDILCEVSL